MAQQMHPPSSSSHELRMTALFVIGFIMVLWMIGASILRSHKRMASNRVIRGFEVRMMRRTRPTDSYLIYAQSIHVDRFSDAFIVIHDAFATDPTLAAGVIVADEEEQHWIWNSDYNKEMK